MEVRTEKQPFQERDAISLLETVDAATGQRQVLKEFRHLIEAPNWLPGGDALLYNAGGRLWKFHLDTLESEPVDTGFADCCNNDHVLSPDGTQVAYIAYKKGDVEPGDHPAHKNVEIRVMDAGGQNTRVLAKLFGGQGTLNVNSWSPDGKNLAFVSYRLK